MLTKSRLPASLQIGVSVLQICILRTHQCLVVQNIVPPNVMIPPGRLLSLIEQSLQAQGSVTDCYDNCIQTRTSLFFDATSSIDCLPISCTQTLNEHKDQVLSVAFSPDGCWLASCCQDGLVGFWKVREDGLKLSLPIQHSYANV